MMALLGGRMLMRSWSAGEGWPDKIFPQAVQFMNHIAEQQMAAQRKAAEAQMQAQMQAQGGAPVAGPMPPPATAEAEAELRKRK